MLLSCHPDFPIAKIKQQRQVGVAIFRSGKLPPIAIHGSKVLLDVPGHGQFIILERGVSAGKIVIDCQRLHLGPHKAQDKVRHSPPPLDGDVRIKLVLKDGRILDRQALEGVHRSATKAFARPEHAGTFMLLAW